MMQFGGKVTIFLAFLFLYLLQNHHTTFQIHNIPLFNKAVSEKKYIFAQKP